MRLALLFIGLPLLELYILIKIGSHLGAFPTIALIIFRGPQNLASDPAKPFARYCAG
jgi:hypothetical protein